MRSTKAIQVLSALSQPVRLQVLERLIGAGSAGLSAGDLAVATKASPSALSAHLAILTRAGILKSAKVGRHVIYRAKPEAMDEVVSFLRGLGKTSEITIPDDPS
ncbi:MAG: transcriptional regulator [Sphingomonas sp.]|nr:MAG: transcriptional regulator [Sphingomonas sp.]